MDSSCDLLRQLCSHASEDKLLHCEGEQTKLHHLDQLLDLILELMNAVDDAARRKENQCEEMGGLGLEKSRLCIVNTAPVSEDDPGQIGLTSEALYCSRLLDVTPTDDRLLSTPRRIFQLTEEINSIKRQNWLCVGGDNAALSVSCSCVGDHFLNIVRALCRCLLCETWESILSNIAEMKEPCSISKDIDAPGDSDNLEPIHLGLKLHHTFLKIQLCCSQMQHLKSTEDFEYVVQSVHQILDMLPPWMKSSEYKNVVRETKPGLVKLHRLCRQLRDDLVTVNRTYKGVALGVASVGTEEEVSPLEQLVTRVNERLHRYEDSLIDMLTHQCYWDKEEWIDCLERNSSVLCDQRICKLIYDVAMVMKDRQKQSDTYNRILKVFLTSFASLPPLLQDQMCEAIWSHPRGHTLFSSYVEEGTNFHQEMTSAFNRLVNVGMKEGLDEAIGRVAMVALQSPSDTLYTAVNRAVSNSAALPSVMKVLQMLPSLGRFQVPGDSKPLLVHILNDVIDSCNELSSSEEANLVDLVSNLLQPCRLFSSCPYENPPLLSHSFLVETCIMPYLHGSHGDVVAPDMKLELCVKLLDASLTRYEAQTSSQNTEWIPSVNLYPMILCLCDIIDQSVALWDSNSCLTPDCKELAVELLLRIASILEVLQGQQEQDGEALDSGLQWLVNKTYDLHWTTQLLLGKSLSGCLQEYKKMVPACLFHLCDLPAEDWGVLPETEPDPSSLLDQLMVFFQCCRISDQLQAQMYQALKSPETASIKDVYQATLIAMATVLPQSTLGEIKRLSRMLHLLIQDGVLKVPISSQFLTCLPMMQFAEHRVALCMCQFLTSLVSLLASEYCHYWISLPLWGHTIKAIVVCLKEIASDLTRKTTPSKSTTCQDLGATPGSFFALTQVLCHTCHMITLVPGDVADQLFVLTLDLLGRIEEVLSSNSNQDEFEWTNQKPAVETLIKNLENEEQRQTLMQKLSSLA